MLKNKKGSLQDILLIGVILLVFSISTLFGFLFVSNINTEFQANDAVDSYGKTASSTLTGFFPTVIDNSFLFLAIGLAIGMLVLAALVRVHPIFIPLFFIALVFFIFLSGIFSNIYQEMAANTELLVYADQLTFISLIMTYLPLIVGIFGMILMIVMYKMWQNAQQ